MTVHDMTLTGPSGKGLVYNGTAIRDKGEMLSLTDMWRAAGSPEGQRPANWARKEGRAFIQFVADTHNVPVGHIIKGQRGKGGDTFGHWQIGIAFAKYLSHDFHMWGNRAIREKMEANPVGAGLPSDVLEQIERSFGISKMLSHKVTVIESTVQTLATAVAAIAAAIQPPGTGLYVEGVTSGEIWKRHNLPNLKNGARWLGNRLTEMGCQMDGCRSARLGTRRARMFDPDKAEACMKNGLLQKARSYASERGRDGRQAVLTLISPAPGV